MGNQIKLASGFTFDYTNLFGEGKVTQAELAEKTGTSPSYVNRLIKKPEKIVTQQFSNNNAFVNHFSYVLVLAG